MSHVQFDREAIAEFCRRNHIRKLSLFGSVLTDRFRPDSDVDVLVEFEAGAPVGLFELARMRFELEAMIGRRIDLRTPEDLSRYFRDEVVQSAEVQYRAN